MSETGARLAKLRKLRKRLKAMPCGQEKTVLWQGLKYAQLGIIMLRAARDEEKVARCALDFLMKAAFGDES